MKSNLAIKINVLVLFIVFLSTNKGNFIHQQNKIPSSVQNAFQYYEFDRKTNKNFNTDVSLVQHIPYRFSNNNKNDLGSQQCKKTFFIDARPKTQNQIHNQKQLIETILRFIKSKGVNNIENIIRQMEIERFEWDQKENIFIRTVLKMDQLSMLKHNQFYSIVLPTLKEGKYKLTITYIKENKNFPELQVVYFILNQSSKDQSQKVNYQQSIFPIQADSDNTFIFPFNKTFSIPIHQPSQNIILQIQSCSFQKSKFFYSLNDPNPLNKNQFKDQNKKNTIFLLKNHQNPYSSILYLKSVHLPQVYLFIDSQPQFIDQKKNNSQTQINSFLLKVRKSSYVFNRDKIKLSQTYLSSIKYSIKGNDIQISFKKVIPLLKNTDQKHLKVLKKAKIIYKLYASNNTDALAKRTLCHIKTYQQGQQIKIFQKIILETYIQVKVQNQVEKAQPTQELVKISLWELKSYFLEHGPELFFFMKVFIKFDDNLISQILENPEISSLNLENYEQAYFYSPFIVKIPDYSWFQIYNVKFWKLMWTFIGLFVLLSVLIFFVGKICKLWKKKVFQSQIKEQINSPRIVISGPKVVDKRSKSKQDSYGFYPSPPSSSSNIKNAYEFGGTDQIIEEQQSQQKSRRQGQIIYQPLSPSYY